MSGKKKTDKKGTWNLFFFIINDILQQLLMSQKETWNEKPRKTVTNVALFCLESSNCHKYAFCSIPAI